MDFAGAYLQTQDAYLYFAGGYLQIWGVKSRNTGAGFGNKLAMRLGDKAFLPLPNPSPYICAIWQWDVDKVL